MSTLKERLQADFTANWKAHRELETATLRVVRGAIQTAEKSGKTEQDFTDAQVLALLTSEAKKRRDTAVEYRKVGAADRAEREDAEAGVIEAYLPQQLDEAGLQAVLAGVLSGFENPTRRDFGAIMKATQAQIAATGKRVDGKTLSTLVNTKIA